MAHAIMSLRPKKRYSIGIDSKFFWFVITCVPRFVIDVRAYV